MMVTNREKQFVIQLETNRIIVYE